MTSRTIHTLFCLRRSIPLNTIKRVWINQNKKRVWIDKDIIDGSHYIYYVGVSTIPRNIFSWKNVLFFCIRLKTPKLNSPFSLELLEVLRQSSASFSSGKIESLREERLYWKRKRLDLITLGLIVELHVT